MASFFWCAGHGAMTWRCFEALDQWLRRKMRVIAWRQWKRPRTRARKLVEAGLDRKRAYESAYNGHGPWWNAGASHMNQALTTKSLRAFGLLSLIEEHARLSSVH